MTNKLTTFDGRNFSQRENGLWLPFKSPYDKILLFGSTGSGKSTTADFLAETTGFPHMHSDEPRFNPDLSMNPDEIVGGKIIEFTRDNPNWILDYVRFGGDKVLLDWLLEEANLVLHFDFPIEESRKGYLNKVAQFKQGIPPIGLPNSPGIFENEETLPFLVDTCLRYKRELPELNRKLSKISATVKVLNSMQEVDEFNVELLKEIEGT